MYFIPILSIVVFLFLLFRLSKSRREFVDVGCSRFVLVSSLLFIIFDNILCMIKNGILPYTFDFYYYTVYILDIVAVIASFAVFRYSLSYFKFYGNYLKAISIAAKVIFILLTIATPFFHETKLYLAENPDGTLFAGYVMMAWHILSYFIIVVTIIIDICHLFDPKYFVYREKYVAIAISHFIILAFTALKFIDLSLPIGSIGPFVAIPYFFFKITETNVCVDDITGLSNRRQFLTDVDCKMRFSGNDTIPWCVMIFDIDQFRNLNEGFGHLEGDKVLSTVGEALVRLSRDSNGSVYRYEGDDFLVIKDVSSKDPANELNTFGRKVNAELAGFCALNNKLYRVSASFGYAVYDAAAAESIPELLKRADDMLYSSKKSGKNKFWA